MYIEKHWLQLARGTLYLQTYDRTLSSYDSIYLLYLNSNKEQEIVNVATDDMVRSSTP